MRLVIFREDRDPSHTQIADALAKSIRKHGDTCEFLPIREFSPTQIHGFDAVFTYHITFSKPILDACLGRGVPVIYYDKGYTHRGWRGLHQKTYFRFSVNGFQPLDYFQSFRRPPDRWLDLKIPLKKFSGKGTTILFAGCSHFFAAWHGFELAEYAGRIVSEIRKFTPRPIVYRPKKSAAVPPPIPGTIFSHRLQKIEHALEDAHALVTFSSNAAVDAIFAGVPAFVLGPSIARPVANTNLSFLENPYFPSEEDRLQWCSDLAYCQWRLDEIESGQVWESVKEILGRAHAGVVQHK